MCNTCTRDLEIEPSVPDIEPVKMDKLEGFKKRHNITTDPGDDEKQKDVEYQPDLLAVSTQHTKLVFDYTKKWLNKFQETKAFAVASRTPQPMHISLAVLVLLGWLARPGEGGTRGWKALYVGTVAIHLGSQVWMTLVSGLALYFTLPRHVFGQVQTVLFPVYYAFSSGVSLLGLSAYVRIQFLNNFQNTSYVQFALLLVVFLIELYIRIYMVKPMLVAKHIKTQMEETAGGGQEVGKHVLGELAHCPRYMRVLKTFRTYHSTIAMGTLITLGCSLYSTMIIVDGLCSI